MSTFTLRDDQRHDVAQLHSNPTRAALIGTTVGGGKTATAVQAAQLATKDNPERIILVIAPINTFSGWQRHVELITGEQMSIVSNSSKPGKAGFEKLCNLEPGWYVIGWEYARTFDLTVLPVDYLIGDEIHRQQNRNSASHVMFRSLAHTTIRNGGWALALSATPYGNKAEGAWATCNALWGTQEKVPSTRNAPRFPTTRIGKPTKADEEADVLTLRYDYFWPFVEDYIGKENNGYTVEANRFEREPGLISSEMPLYIRHGQGYQCCQFHPKGIQADLPKRIVRPVPVPMAPAQAKLYKQMAGKMMAWIDDNAYPITTGGYPIVQSIRLRQIALATPTVDMVSEMNTKTGEAEDKMKVSYPLDAKSSKLDALVEIFNEVDAAGIGERMLVLTHSAAVIPVVVARLNKAAKRNVAAAWMGGVSSTNRDILKHQFITGAHEDVKAGTPAENLTRSPGLPNNMDDVQIIVAQIGAIGEGVDGLQWVCANEVWLSHESNALLNVQALGRLERDGQLRTINSWDIVAEGTIEVEQLDSLAEQGERMRMQLNR